MITTKNFNADSVRPASKCPECGHVGPAHSFDFKLPGISTCFEGQGRSYAVQYPGEAEPRKYNTPPTHEEIAKTYAECEAKHGGLKDLDNAAKKRAPRTSSKNTVLTADPI
jgi:hypothetical protein